MARNELPPSGYSLLRGTPGPVRRAHRHVARTYFGGDFSSARILFASAGVAGL